MTTEPPPVEDRPPPRHTYHLHILLRPEEASWLRSKADAADMTPSAWARRLLRREHRRFARLQGRADADG